MGKICNPEVITRALIKSSPHLCFYKMQGQQHLRLKSSLTRARVKKDPAFLLSRVSADLMAQASPLASVVYEQMPAAGKVKGVFQRIVGAAKTKLREGIAAEEVVRLLEGMFLQMEKPVVSPSKALSAAMQLQKNTSQQPSICCVFYVDKSGRLNTSVHVQDDFPVLVQLPAP